MLRKIKFILPGADSESEGGLAPALATRITVDYGSGPAPPESERTNYMPHLIVAYPYRTGAVLTVLLFLLTGCAQPDLQDSETLARIVAEAEDQDDLSQRGADRLWYAPNESEPYSGWARRMHESRSSQIDQLRRIDDGWITSSFGWYENGQMSREEHYEAGERTGRWARWHENGQIGLEEHYEAGERDGLRTKWDRSGEKLMEFDYDVWNVVTSTEFEHARDVVTEVDEEDGTYGVFFNGDTVAWVRPTLKELVFLDRMLMGFMVEESNYTRIDVIGQFILDNWLPLRDRIGVGGDGFISFEFEANSGCTKIVTRMTDARSNFFGSSRISANLVNLWTGDVRRRWVLLDVGDEDVYTIVLELPRYDGHLSIWANQRR